MTRLGFPVVLAVAAALATVARGAGENLQTSCDFEAGLPAGAVAKGDVTVQGDTVHSGARALRVGRGGEVLLPVSPADGFGAVTLWVYDSGLRLQGDAATTRAFGPLWGLSNAAQERLLFGLLYAPYLAGNDSYGWISTAEGGWGSRRYARSPRKQGWRQWVLRVNNQTDIVASVDGAEATGFDIMASKFFRGYNGIYLRGATDMDEPLVVDDIQATWQAAELTSRTRPLPGERRKPPNLAPLALKPELVGKHPRLFFTAADIPRLRERCRTTHKTFFDRLMGGAAAYLGQMPPANAGECADDQTQQQWGWWRLSTLSFAYVATGEERYGRKAIQWMETLCSYEDWGEGEEMNQSMGAANLLTGIACAYDWCYDLMTDAQRAKIRGKLLRQVGELCWNGFMDPNTAGYWKGDHQNNHRHHRLSGLTLASLAILGEEPEAAAYAAYAASEARQVADALPPDGSNHEGPGYAAFGHSYVVLLFDALRNCTGVDLFAACPGLALIPTFRAHVLTPGFQGVFNFGDGGPDTYYFNHYLFKLAAEYKDPAAQALMKAAYDASPESYCYFPWDIIWYDADLKPTPLDQIPTWHYFSDLELATYRSSWTDPKALAVLLKCGPYGGHRLNELAKGWVNVAHDHPDANHFMLFWQGQRWALDDGYPHSDKAGVNHNIILVDGKGPLQRGGDWLQPIDNMAKMGRIDKVVQRPGLFAARGDATRYYPGMAAMFRWLAVVRDRYVVICDHLASADGPKKFEWLLHSDADWSQPGPGRWELTKGGQKLHLQFALPQDLAAKLGKFVLEGRDQGQLLRVSPAQPGEAAHFLAVLSAGDCPPLRATESAARITLSLGQEAELTFTVADGDVTLQ